jgi:hypothetical protein
VVAALGIGKSIFPYRNMSMRRFLPSHVCSLSDRQLQFWTGHSEVCWLTHAFSTSALSLIAAHKMLSTNADYDCV